MVLNYIWIGFFAVAFLMAAFRALSGDLTVFPAIVDQLHGTAKTAAEIALGLTGAMTLWLGIMKVGEQGGAIAVLTRLVSPFFSRLFPEIPRDHPAMGAMMMNFAANMLGLDNAATPVGLKAMSQLQELNPDKQTASNAQIMFLVLNTSGLTLIPVSIIALRVAQGSATPTDVFIPILAATFFSTLAGLLFVSISQRINLFQPVVMSYLAGATALVGGMIFYFWRLDRKFAPERSQLLVELGNLSSLGNAATAAQTERIAKIQQLLPGPMGEQSQFLGTFIILAIIMFFLALATAKKINVYESFVEGAKEGFGVAVKIIPYLVAMLVAIAVFRASGALAILMDGFRRVFAIFGDTRWVEALPVALMKPLSGSGARGAAVDVMKTHGPDSFAGSLACTFQGSTETTFYVLAVYFGAVGIVRTRYTMAAGLFADLAGIIGAVLMAYLFFGSR